MYPITEKVLLLIQSCLEREWTIAELAEHYGCTNRTVRRLFRQIFVMRHELPAFKISYDWVYNKGKYGKGKKVFRMEVK